MNLRFISRKYEYVIMINYSEILCLSLIGE